MTAAEILARIVELEGAKLEKKAAKKDPLGKDDLELLEALARTVKSLRPERIGRPPKETEEFDEADLKLLEG